MKNRTQKSRADAGGVRRAARLAAAAIVTTSFASCRSLHVGPPRASPPLAGLWVDASHATAADTSIWALDAGGSDDIVHVTWVADSARGGAAERSETRRHYGRWYVLGSLADTAGRRICFNERPGRSAGACYAYRLDTLDGSAGDVAAAPSRQLTLFDYHGTHGTRDRVLIERRP